MTDKPTMHDAFAKASTAKPVEKPKPKRQKIFNAKANPGRQGKRGMTHYVTPATLDDLKAIAVERSNREDADILLKDVIAEGLNLVLERYGRKPTA